MSLAIVGSPLETRFTREAVEISGATLSKTGRRQIHAALARRSERTRGA